MDLIHLFKILHAVFSSYFYSPEFIRIRKLRPQELKNELNCRWPDLKGSLSAILFPRYCLLAS